MSRYTSRSVSWSLAHLLPNVAKGDAPWHDLDEYISMGVRTCARAARAQASVSRRRNSLFGDGLAAAAAFPIQETKWRPTRDNKVCCIRGHGSVVQAMGWKKT